MDFNIEDLTPEQVSQWQKTLHNINRRFIILASKDNGKFIPQLVELGFDINHQDLFGDFPLAYFVTNPKYLEVLKNMLRNGADVNLANRLGRTALMTAAASNTIEAIDILTAADADINHQDITGNTSLIHAMNSTGNLPTLKFLILKGADVNLKNYLGQTAIFSLISRINRKPEQAEEYKNCIIELLTHHADINALDANGHTPLIHQCKIGSDPKIISFLTYHGADISIKDDDGKDALYFAKNNPKLKNFSSILKTLEY